MGCLSDLWVVLGLHFSRTLCLVTEKMKGNQKIQNCGFRCSCIQIFFLFFSFFFHFMYSDVPTEFNVIIIIFLKYHCFKFCDDGCDGRH
jgi:hypothetical protein